MQNKIFYRIF